MDRRSPYYTLKWRVECMPPGNPATWWRTIAAFDHDGVALDYAADCRAKNTPALGYHYRVMQRVGRKWIEIRAPG